MLKKNEWLLIAGVLLVALLLLAWNRYQNASLAQSDARVQVSVDGTQQLLLIPGQHKIAGQAGEQNTIEILSNGVRMAQANCPDQWCVRKGIVPPGADIIVCLPHRLIVRWVGAGGVPVEFDDVDVVT
ncbi:MAG: NusG domain II-containing protein [Clostridia bacterium]|nr:NusG domain II-containing protein [Clostridia bacterium]